MTKSDLDECLRLLSKKRPIFTSEVDFQLSFGLEIKAMIPQSKIILEYPIEIHSGESKSTIYIDMVVEIEGKIHPIELKYKTKEVKGMEIHGSMFDLKNQGAHPRCRYAFLRDIERLEGLKDFSTGYAIMITNDMNYVNVPKDTDTIDKNFRIHQSSNPIPNGYLSWNIQNPQPDHWTSKYRCINIKGSYKMDWSEYSTVKTQSNKNIEFKYLICEIKIRS